MSTEFHQDYEPIKRGQVFVFGSNLAGIHGAGAAAAALNYGAAWGEGIGFHGETYAIPTKDADIRSMKLSQIKPYIAEFVEFTKANPNHSFYVTRVGCGLAGFKDSQIAPLFKGAENCSFAEQWKQYLV